MIDSDKYSFEKYIYLDRWDSYYYQIKETLLLKPKNIFEIGIGGGIFGSYIKNHTIIEYKNMDIREDTNPDIVGSIDSIPLVDKSYDVVCAFEILEHLPFDKFEISLKELHRVSQKNVIISLPHFGPPIKVNFKLPFFKEIKFAIKIPVLIKHVYNGEHYWEIGKKGYSAKKIRNIIKKYFILKKEFVPFENQYHHFYILEKN